MTKSIQDIEGALIDLAATVLEQARNMEGKEQADAFKAVTAFYTAFKKAHAKKGGRDDDKNTPSGFTALQKQMADITKAN